MNKTLVVGFVLVGLALGGCAVGVKQEEVAPAMQMNDYSARVSDLQARAEAGDPRAMLDLSIQYTKGWGVAKDNVKGYALLKQSAQTGYPAAQAWMAVAFGKTVADYRNNASLIKAWADSAVRATQSGQWAHMASDLDTRQRVAEALVSRGLVGFYSGSTVAAAHDYCAALQWDADNVHAKQNLANISQTCK